MMPLLVLVVLVLVLASSVSSAAMLSGLGDSFCTLQRDGQVYCFGLGIYGSFGVGDYEDYPFPVQMRGVSRSTHVSHGARHTCIVDNKRAKCAGDNSLGQLGDGTGWSSPELVLVGNLSTVVVEVKVSSHYHSCAKNAGGGLACWGWGDYGQLGTVDLRVAVPFANGVFGMESAGVVDFALGFAHTCAIVVTTATPQVKCTGRNNYGQLGIGESSSSRALVWEMTPVVGLPGVPVAVSAGDFHTCAAVAMHGVWCWGDNYFGALGAGPQVGISHVPLQVRGLPPMISSVSVFCGNLATFALVRSSVNNTVSVYRFGYSWGVSVGDTSETYAYEAALMPHTHATPSEIQGGSAVCILLTPSLQIQCAGADTFGQLGDGLPLRNSSHEWTAPLSVKLATPRPTLFPTRPTRRPTKWPTSRPTTLRPTLRPTRLPTSRPTRKPTRLPTARPTAPPTTLRPTLFPTTLRPTPRPTRRPTALPTLRPTKRPTHTPTLPTRRPTLWPTLWPSRSPSAAPTRSPSAAPSLAPTWRPTLLPTRMPSRKPTRPTRKPTRPPSPKPSKSPSIKPTRKPTSRPTERPSKSPTLQPTHKPTQLPTVKPTRLPTHEPTGKPSRSPTSKPSISI